MDESDPELEVDLSKIHQLFEKCIPPETEVCKALKYYVWEHKKQNGIICSFSLGILEFQLALSVKKIRADTIDCLLLLLFEDCCDQVEVLNIKKRQLCAGWFWKNQKEVPWILTVSDEPDDFFAHFEDSNPSINQFKFSNSDLVSISSEVILPTDNNNQTTVYVFKQLFDWVSYLTVSSQKQEITIVAERHGEKFSLLKLSNCHELRLYDKERKVVEIFAGSHSEPNIHCFIDCGEVPYVWVEIGYSKNKPPKPSPFTYVKPKNVEQIMPWQWLKQKLKSFIRTLFNSRWINIFYGVR